MAHTPGSTDRRRAEMVERQLVGRDITDPIVLAAMGSVPRHEFVDAPEHDAYDDRPIPIGHGATISQPYIVALMAQALRLTPDDRVLEVGTGCGYGAAVLASIAHHVTTIEVIDELATDAARRLAAHAPPGTVEVVVGDGSLGYAAGAPYDAICVTAAAPEIPEPLIEQLAAGGRLVIPVGRATEILVRLTKHADRIERDDLLPVRFVALRGEHGW